MSSRSTRNSQSAALDALSTAVSAEPSCASAIADPAANPPCPFVAASPAVAAVALQQDQPSPAFLATVVQAVKDALAADRAPARSVPNASSQPSTTTILGGVPHAAATNLTEWSSINVQLFNFHAAGAAVRASNAPVDGSPEPRGSASSTIVCKSWNRGRCVAPYASCRFAHICSNCSGLHRVSACPGQTSNQPNDTVKRRSASPSRSRSKSRRL
ncbi:unnamed protein product [Porites evermanni]|uniref:C3H1-type domain-containing protein n=1 Tax=Porites evermanni TaxID=104178 RepID=A0ABN8MM92_9CNID|nr:unnamed protein product [Porites evermanni]